LVYFGFNIVKLSLSESNSLEIFGKMRKLLLLVLTLTGMMCALVIPSFKYTFNNNSVSLIIKSLSYLQ